MTGARRDPDRVFAAWMAEGPDALRDDVLATVVAKAASSRQRRTVRDRLPAIPPVVRWAALAGAAAMVVGIAVLAGARLLPAVTGPAATAESATPTTGASASANAYAAIDSTAYPYRWTFPSGDIRLPGRRAAAAWDGSSPCIADDPCTDSVVLDGTPGEALRTVWVFGTRTSLSADAFARDVLSRTAAWRPCATTTAPVRDLAVDGSDAAVYAFTCTADGRTDLHLRVIGVRDGLGFVIGMAKLSSGEALDADTEIGRLTDWLRGFRWTP